MIQITDLHWSAQKDIFKKMDMDSLCINLRKIKACLDDTRFVEHWIRMQYSKQEIEKEIVRRNQKNKI